MNFINSFVLLNILLWISFHDIKTLRIKILPIVIGFIYRLIYVISFYFNNQDIYSHIQNLFISASVPFIIMLMLSYTGRLIFGKEVLGHGDALITGMGGSWIGLKGIYISILMAFLLASFANIIKTHILKHSPTKLIPFAPYLSITIFGIWILGTDFIDLIIK